MRILIVVLMFLLCSLGCSANTGDILLSIKGKPCAAIVVSSDAIPAEKTAASELAKHFKLVTGADFPIVSSVKQARQGACIFIGQTKSVKEMMPCFDFSKLGRDGIVIRKVGNNLVLAGDRPRGTLYAIYTFLEDNVGCRWWAPDASYMPKKPTLSVRVKDVTYTPPFMCREAFNKNVIGQNPEFAVKLKLNGHHQNIPPELGSHYAILGWCHTFSQLIPPEKYFTDHPEWFSEIKGKRMNGYLQLCLTNEEMRKELTKNALEWIKKNPDAGIISIAQNDAGGACQCPKCRAIVEEEGAESGPIIRFVNAVAEDIEKQYPDFLVETLAYQYTRKAPAKVKPRQNVVVRLCSIECDFSKPLTAPSNEAFYKDLQDWKAISPQLYVWDYTVNYMNLLTPYPNWRVLAPNVRLFAKSNVIGLFEQGDGYNPDANFAPLRTWLLAHLMWNPKLDENKLMDQFLNGYYGAAGKYMREYIDLICDSAEKSGKPIPCFHTDFSFLTPEVLNKATAIFDAAEKAVQGDDELMRRVKLQRAAVYLAMVITPAGEDTLAPKGLEQVLDKFFAIAEPSGNIYMQEGTVMSAQFRQYLKDVSQGKPTSGFDVRKASQSQNYADEKAFAELYKTMTEVYDFPKDGWKFKRDRSAIGFDNGWYKTDFDDSAWRDFSIAKFWEEQIGDYNGVAWYRKKFTAPQIEPGKKVYVAIGAADDYAKVWLNGKYLGEQHLPIAIGWNVAFALDATEALKPGQENVLAVQVEYPGALGGLWKSVKLMVKN